MEQKKEKEELTSMNAKFSEFDLQKLEERLETDPLAVGGLLDLNSDIDLYGHCTGYTCPGMSCESYDW